MKKPATQICPFGWVENGFRPPNGHIRRSPHKKYSQGTTFSRRTLMWVCRHLGVKFFHKSWNDGEGSRPGACSQKTVVLGFWGGLDLLVRLCEFVIRLRSAAGVPAFKGLPRWDPVSDWPSFEAESELWLRGLVWNLPSSSSL